jgi:hypothetical protein
MEGLLTVCKLREQPMKKYLRRAERRVKTSPTHQLLLVGAITGVLFLAAIAYSVPQSDDTTPPIITVRDI